MKIKRKSTLPLRFKRLIVLLLAGLILVSLVSTFNILPATKKVSSEGPASTNPARVQGENNPVGTSSTAPYFSEAASPASAVNSSNQKQTTPDQKAGLPTTYAPATSTVSTTKSITSSTPASTSSPAAAETTKSNAFGIDPPQPLPVGPLALVRLSPGPGPGEPDMLKRLAKLEPVRSGRFQPIDYLWGKEENGSRSGERLLAVINLADVAYFTRSSLDYARLDPDADTGRYFVVLLPTSLPPNGETWLESHWQPLDQTGNRVIFKAELPLYAGTGFRSNLQISKLPPRIYLSGITTECPCPALAAATFATPTPALSTKPSGNQPLTLQELKTQLQAVNEKAIEKVVSQIVQNEVRGKGQLNTRYTDSAGSVYLAERLYLYFFALGLKVEYDSFVEGAFGTITSNVIASLGQGPDPKSASASASAEVTGQAGTTKPVWLVAHYDSLGERNIKGISSPKVPAPAANDDGVGLAGFMEIARLLAPYQLKQPVKFIAFGAEEQGMLGSQHFAFYHTMPAGKSALINIDSFGYNPGAEDWVVLGYGNNGEALKDNMLEYVKKYNLNLRLEVRDGEPFFRSDDFYFDQKGFSAVALTDTFSVQNPNNHTPNDSVENVNFSTTRKVIQLALVTVAEQSESVP